MNNYIHPFYVNAFFFVSGYLLFRKQLLAPIISESRLDYITVGGGNVLFMNVLYKLMLPTIVFSIIEYLPKKLLRAEPIELHTILSNTIGGGTYWFTSALLVAEFVILLLLLTRKSSIWFYLCFCLSVAFLGWYLIRVDFHLFGFGRDPWAYRRGFLATAFLASGGLYWKYESLFERYKKYLFPLTAIIYILVFTFGVSSFRVLISTMDINLIGGIASAVGCVLLVYVCKRLPINRYLSFVGQYSLCFYFLSGALPMIMSSLFRRFVPGEHIWGLMIVFALCISIAYGITWFMNKYMSFLFDFRKLKK